MTLNFTVPEKVSPENPVNYKLRKKKNQTVFKFCILFWYKRYTVIIRTASFYTLKVISAVKNYLSFSLVLYNYTVHPI